VARQKWKMAPMTAHHIRLHSSVGDFSPDFVIAKNMARVTPLPLAYRPDGNSLEYTVFVKGRSFSDAAE
jgi:hypothetical protein